MYSISANPMPEPNANPGDINVQKCNNCGFTEINHGQKVVIEHPIILT